MMVVIGTSSPFYGLNFQVSEVLRSTQMTSTGFNSDFMGLRWEKTGLNGDLVV